MLQQRFQLLNLPRLKVVQSLPLIRICQQIGAAPSTRDGYIFLPKSNPTLQGLGATAQSHHRHLVASTSRRHITGAIGDLEGVIHHLQELWEFRRRPPSERQRRRRLGSARRIASGKRGKCTLEQRNEALLVTLSRGQGEGEQDVDQ
jgi:hypothetical protein